MNLPEPKSDATASTPASDWSIERAIQYYNMAGWGAGFFSVNEKGHMVVHPHGQGGPTIDLMDVVEDIQERGLGFPVNVRFMDVLRARVRHPQRDLRQGGGRARLRRAATTASTRSR